ncbi:MAG: endonuclease [Gammaproteobacteria bacterium]|nr:endonuclease [Gammaproteobacteria bacterium]MDH5800864.1 endonuclease [Gammaproteobacteria bacterium]
MNFNIPRTLPLLSAFVFLYAIAVEAEEVEVEPAPHNHPFWQLYPEGGWTLYCGEHFTAQSNIVAEPVYSAYWIKRFFSCSSLEECRSKQTFREIENDLHNLYPALPMIVLARKDDDYGIVAGEFREYFECDFEHDGQQHVVEPRPIARGNIARSLFYMHKNYGLPLKSTQFNLFMDWHKNDPPSKDEIRRNELIEKLQGNRNPFIDHPDTAEDLRASVARSSETQPSNNQAAAGL